MFSRQLSNIQEVALKPVPITSFQTGVRAFTLVLTGKNSAEICAQTEKITLQTLRNHLHHIIRTHTHTA